MTTNTIVSIFISVLSLSSLGLAYYKARDLRRYACLCGLLAQPFWIAHVVLTQSWGIVVLTPVYAVIYILAVWQHWGPDSQ